MRVRLSGTVWKDWFSRNAGHYRLPDQIDMCGVMALVPPCEGADNGGVDGVMAWRRWTLAFAFVLAGCGTIEDAATSTPIPAPTASTTSAATPTATSTVAIEPCRLDITNPQIGAILATAVTTLRGTTDPGCIVEIGGSYLASADSGGAWALDLELMPGDNTITIVATNLDGVKTETDVLVSYAPFVLGATGLGVVAFGDAPDDTVAVLTNLLGRPSYDEVFESPFAVPFEGWSGPDRGPQACHATTANACFDYIRFISWNDAGLWVTFSDLTVNRDAEPGDDAYLVQVRPSLQGYSYWGGDGDPLAYTADGITVGSTVSELLEVYDDAVTFTLGCVEIPEYSVLEPNTADGSSLRGALDFDGPHAWSTLDSGHIDPTSLDPTATVRSIAAGTRSDC